MFAMIYTIAVLKIQISPSQLASSGQKIYLKFPPGFRSEKIKTVSMAKKLFSGTKRCDRECQGSESPYLLTGSTDKIIPLCLIFQGLKILNS